MRYYAISITDDLGNAVPVGPFPDRTPQFTSYVNNQNIGGALNVIMDLQVFTWDESVGASYVQVSGISLQDISQANNLNGMNIKIYGGMKKGLPLANPDQSGLLLTGSIQQAFGNWQGTLQTLDMIIVQGFGTADGPKNLVLNWQTGTFMGDAVAQTLLAAFPGYTVAVQIDPRLILAIETQPAPFQSVGQLAVWLNQMSREIIGGDYQGIKITAREKEFFIFDGSSPTIPKQISAFDLIGQPTWMGAGQVNFKVVMRHDLQVSDFILMPKQTLQLTTSASVSQARNKSAFQGVFQIRSLRHVGNFRQKDANSWATVVDAVVIAA